MTGPNEQPEGSWAYRSGVAVAFVASFVSVWTTIVRDDGTGIGFFLVIMAAAVGGYAARFRPDGMARTMIGVAIMQASFGAAIATAPSTANTPDGVSKALVFSGVFAALWLISATLFRVAARGNRKSFDPHNAVP